MPRKDGEFPNYTKIRIDPNNWPENYWDFSRQCVACDKKWPNTHLFVLCLDCKNKTIEKPATPDVRWPEAVSALNFRFESLYSIWNEGVEDDKLEWEDVKSNGKLDNQKVSQAVEELIENVEARPVQN